MTAKIGFGDGCHWCTEAVFQSLKGIERVEQGFISAPDDAFSEAVVVAFDPDVVPIQRLVEVHVATHASRSDHSMRGKYRSAVYVFDEDQRAAAHAALAGIEKDTGARLVTRVLLHCGFRASDTRFHDYYYTDRGRPFCQTYIDPKLARLRQGFAELYRDPQEAQAEC